METKPAATRNMRVVLEISRDELAARGRKGAAVTPARHAARNLTQAGRAAFLSRFLRDADPNDELAPDERARRAADLRRAYFRDLARRSAEARAARTKTPAK